MERPLGSNLMLCTCCLRQIRALNRCCLRLYPAHHKELSVLRKPIILKRFINLIMLTYFVEHLLYKSHGWHSFLCFCFAKKQHRPMPTTTANTLKEITGQIQNTTAIFGGTFGQTLHWMEFVLLSVRLVAKRGLLKRTQR